MIHRLCISIFDRTQFYNVLVIDVVLWDLAMYDDYVDSLQSTIHISVDPRLICAHLIGSSLMSLMNL